MVVRHRSDKDRPIIRVWAPSQQLLDPGLGPRASPGPVSHGALLTLDQLSAPYVNGSCDCSSGNSKREAGTRQAHPRLAVLLSYVLLNVTL